MKLLIIVLTLLINLNAEQYRNWKNTEGKIIEAKLIKKIDEESIQLQKRSGSKFNYAVQKLSTADQKYINSFNFSNSEKNFRWLKYPELETTAKKIRINSSPPFKKSNIGEIKGIKNTISDGWFSVHYGNQLHPEVSDKDIRSAIDYANKYFDILFRELGWPVTYSHQNGYFQDIYILGSGLNGDDSPQSTKAGYQGWVNHNGKLTPVVYVGYSVFNIFSNDTPNGDIQYEKFVLLHELIHCVFNSLPDVAPGWLHEAANGWLINKLILKNGIEAYYSDEFTNQTLMAPHIPIESLGGWRADGAFAGPIGVFGNGQYGFEKEVLAPTIVGGAIQYAKTFPLFLDQFISKQATYWAWDKGYKKGDQLLAALAKEFGEQKTKHLITEYRARQAFADFGKWSEKFLTKMESTLGKEFKYIPIDSITEEAGSNSESIYKLTPYVETVLEKNKKTLKPAEITLPGWTGANQIPLKVKASSSKVSIKFNPLENNMTCQLVYRNKHGKPIYSPYVTKGLCSIELEGRPQNNVIIAVITNTDFVFKKELNQKKFDYRIDLEEGVKKAADIYTPWFAK